MTGFKSGGSGLAEAVSERNICFDVLRILATLAVIIIHVSGPNWSSSSPLPL